MVKKLLFILLVASILPAASQNKKTAPVKIAIKTTIGTITVKLYDQTPIHRNNFIRLVKKHYYDSLLFHRVIKDFMIQAGDPYSKKAKQGTYLGNGGPGYTLPAEIKQELFHKRGALAAAREPDNVNPKKRSSGSQFYIVQGRKFTDSELDKIEKRIQMIQKNELAINFLSKAKNKAIKFKLDSLYKNHLTDEVEKLSKEIIAKAMKEAHQSIFKFTPEMRKIYKTQGGSPHLDSQYTVFGEVISGFNILDKIANTKTDSNDRPIRNIRIISMKIIN